MEMIYFFIRFWLNFFSPNVWKRPLFTIGTVKSSCNANDSTTRLSSLYLDNNMCVYTRCRYVHSFFMEHWGQKINHAIKKLTNSRRNRFKITYQEALNVLVISQYNVPWRVVSHIGNGCCNNYISQMEMFAK